MVKAWGSGNKVTKLIGFDATEDHRTYAGASKLDVCRQPGLPRFKDRYNVRYPLREWGIDRRQCGQIITNAGLPLPPKSACFFCPAMKQQEVAMLADEDPDLYELALEMETIYRSGRHFRGDQSFTVKAEHKLTGEKVDFFTQAASEAQARSIFRRTYDDTVRPYKYQVGVYRAVTGLGRTFAWKDVPLDRRKMELPLIPESDQPYFLF